MYAKIRLDSSEAWLSDAEVEGLARVEDRVAHAVASGYVAAEPGHALAPPSATQDAAAALRSAHRARGTSAAHEPAAACDAAECEEP